MTKIERDKPSGFRKAKPSGAFRIESTATPRAYFDTKQQRWVDAATDDDNTDLTDTAFARTRTGEKDDGAY